MRHYRKNRRASLLFILIASLIMVVLKFVLWDPSPLLPTKTYLPSSESVERVQSYSEHATVDKMPSEEISEYESALLAYDELQGFLERLPEKGVKKPLRPQAKSLPQTKSVPPIFSQKPVFEKVTGSPKIAIIIDDMGMDRKRSHAVMAMHSGLTLAFLPYAQDVQIMAQEAKAQGHEIMIHMPMEPMDSSQNMGSIALRTGMSEVQISAELEKAFGALSGYEGMNNHMGSRFTQEPSGLSVVMKHLKARGLYFVDSKTIGSAVGAQVAWSYGVRAAERDVFLDHEESLTFVRRALRQAEQIARRKGYSIAIGHPKDVTIAGLKEWIPQALESGYELVPVSALVRAPKGKEAGKIAVSYGPPRSSYTAPLESAPQNR